MDEMQPTVTRADGAVVVVGDTASYVADRGNPHEPGTPEFDAWEDGFDAGFDWARALGAPERFS